MSDDQAISIIEEKADRKIRRSEVDGVMYFSIIDVIAVLTNSTAPRQYWVDMKRRMGDSEGWTQLQANILQLKLASRDGKRYNTDAADTATILRVVQSIPSPNAEPIRMWLARVGATELEKTYGPGAPTTLVSLGSSIAEIARNKPDDGDLLGLADYYHQLSNVYRQQAHMESRLRFIEATTKSQAEDIIDLRIRLEEVERNQSGLPEMLHLLRVELLSPDHQNQVRSWVNELARLTGRSRTEIFTDVTAEFEYKDFSDFREADWERIQAYFQERLEEARNRR